ncbi:MAG: 3-dehydroquinate synthase [Candidatus Hodarchaeales archaeon]|jgi:3-dehydroquinate synthase
MVNISLIGYRGVGKSTLGKKMSKHLRMNFIDTDTYIESTVGNISEFFKIRGEMEFRKIESTALKEIFEKNDDTVISHGGGIILDRKNIFLIKSFSKVLFLNLDKETIIKRILNDTNIDRPPLTEMPLEDEIAVTIKERMPLYSQCADKIVDLDDSTEERNLQALIRAYSGLRDVFEIKTIQCNSKQLTPYEILIQRGMHHQIAKNLNNGNKYLIITDSMVRKLYGEHLKQSLKEEGKKCSIISFPTGEKNKNLDTFASIHKEIDLSLDRKSCIIALGGGVTGDMAGFVASTYMRGIPFIQVPTSLLAMVDSSIGGKLGVNTNKGKNCIGVFNNPSRVLIDPLFLSTLPKTFLKDGLAEAIKHALISSEVYLDFIVKNKDRIFSLDSEVLTRLIYESIRIKTSIVEEDEKERNSRYILNFGHTIGHALEAIGEYRNISHGNAVAVGSVVASYISLSRKLIDKPTFDSIKNSFSLIGLPLSLQKVKIKIDPEEVYTYLKHDKKTISGRIKFVLLKGIGKPLIKDDISYQEVVEALNHVS